MVLSVLSMNLVTQHLSVEWEESFLILTCVFFDRWTLHAPPPVILMMIYVPLPHFILYVRCRFVCELLERCLLFV